MVQDKIRLKFFKIGRMKYISHLDLVRTMSGALLRAGIPVYFTEGFNPRPKMVFALPMSVGCESVCELLDIKLTAPMEESELLMKLNEQFPPEMQFTSVEKPESDFSSIAAAEYDIKIYGFDISELSEALKGEIKTMKKSKKGMVETDMAEGILSHSLELCEGGVCMHCNLRATSDGYSKPVNLLAGLSSKLGREIDDYDIMRLRVIDSEGKEFR